MDPWRPPHRQSQAWACLDTDDGESVHEIPRNDSTWSNHYTSWHRDSHNISDSNVQGSFNRNSDGNACPFVTDYTYSTYPVNMGVGQAPPWPGM
jgi:hypothetical protein